MGFGQIELLKSAVAEARTLLEFAITNRHHIDEKIITEFMKAIDELGDLHTIKSVDLEKEAKFWKLYQDLIDATYPVTAASIESSKAALKARLGSTALHTMWAAIVFILVVGLQIMWVFGNNLRGSLDKCEKLISEQQEKRRPINSQFTLLTQQVNQYVFADKNKTDEKAVKIQKELEQHLADVADQLDVIDQNLKSLRNQREPLVTLINGWYTHITWGYWPLDSADKVKDLQAQYDRKKLTPIKFKWVFGNYSSLRKNFYENVETRKTKSDIDQARDQLVVELNYRVDLILDVLQKYGFPVLFGLLGSLIFILRTLIVQIREYSYTVNVSSLSFVRISLGMMAGLLGGMFIPQSDNVLHSLPPLALPFLFGYAVEVLFSFLDRIVKAFIDENQSAKK